MRWLAIINPRSGHRKNSRDIRHIVDCLERTVTGDLDVHVTEHMGEALSLARTRRDVEGFIAVGGDGTIFDIVNGMDLTTQRLAIFPAGTGNGLARDLLLLDPDRALAALDAAEMVAIDVIEVTARFLSDERHRWRVVSTASLGYCADVVELANSSFKPLGGFCYPVASVVQALRAEAFTGRWRCDGKDWQPLAASNIMVNNTVFAGDFEAFPEARLDDGLADAIVARAGFGAQMLHNVSVLSRRHFYLTAPLFTARRLEFELDEDRMLMLDGEIVTGVVGVSFSVVPGALNIVAKRDLALDTVVAVPEHA